MTSSCSPWIVATMSESAAGPGRLERRDQRALALDAALVEPGDGLAEELVVEAEQQPAAGGEVTAADQAHRLAAGGPVERLGDRRPPVDDDRLLGLVGDGEAPDVEAVDQVGVGRGHLRARASNVGPALVDAPEAQRLVADVELREAVGDVLVDDVALVAGLERAAGALDLGAVPHLGRGLVECARGTRTRGRCTTAPLPARCRSRRSRSGAFAVLDPGKGDGPV